MPEIPTPDQLEQIYHAALSAGDTAGVDAALRLLVVQDPHRAQTLFDNTRLALKLVRTQPDTVAQMLAWSWTPPAEPGPEVRRVQPVERYPGDDSIWFEREPDNTGWRLVMRGRPGEPMPWLGVIAAAGSVYGGRKLIDTTYRAAALPYSAVHDVTPRAGAQ